MRATVFYRIAAVLFVLFTAGHTFGFLKFIPPTAEGVAVRDAMHKVHFPLEPKDEAKDYSYGRFYDGFGLYISAYLLFSAVLSWQLGSLARAAPRGIGVIAWAFFGAQVIGLVLNCLYFPTVPAVLSGLIAVCIALGAWFTPSALHG